MSVLQCIFSQVFEPPWSLRTRWLNCLSQMRSMDIRCSHIYREGNTVADSMANLGLSSSSLKWFASPPPVIWLPLHFDTVGLPYQRGVASLPSLNLEGVALFYAVGGAACKSLIDGCDDVFLSSFINIFICPSTVHNKANGDFVGCCSRCGALLSNFMVVFCFPRPHNIARKLLQFCFCMAFIAEKAEWIIYVTDVGQQQHFDMFFKAATLAGWLPIDGSYPKVSHVGFGVVLGEDGKRLRTRSSDDVVRLIDLIDEAKSRSKTSLVERGKSEDWLKRSLSKLQWPLSDYTFDFNQLLNVKGNTAVSAVYLLYMLARICSIIRKSGKDIDELKKKGEIVLGHAGERKLALHLLRFPETVEEACTNLLPSVLCEYFYNLSESSIPIARLLGRQRKRADSCFVKQQAYVVMRKCFHLLGIEAVCKM
ncbi:putative arginine--tRNA ligase [Rosa chinensis]|uniref:arginine--tRNA ligase n=1 Tax=Rosa chinensis TaxID=74649 RepID=A0A2P6R6V1_ROSCH|nr:putative arginine--tRNA ligase [Rosa chinensis]